MKVSPKDKARKTMSRRKLTKRDKQIIKYIPLVKYVVARMFSRVPSFVDRDDMFQAGMVGLIQAVDQFDPSRAVKFESYALHRIRGAIKDSFREIDWAPRSVRQKSLEAERAIHQLETELGRAPTEFEVAQKMNIPLEEYRDLIGAMSAVRVFSLDHPIWCSEEDSGGIPLSEMTEGGIFELDIDTLELQKIIYKTLRLLPERERLILVLYYYENLTLKEIAVVLSVTESRVSQLHSQAILKIKDQIKNIEIIE